MLSDLRKSKLAANAILLLFVFSLFGAAPARAEERYPDVARLSFVSGGVTYSRGDDSDEWDDAVENVPLIGGDRIYAPSDGRAELELSSRNFVRLAPRSYLTTVNLSDDIKQFYLGEGTASFNIRRLASDEDFEIDTPNVAVTFEQPGLYRVAVDENGDSRIVVRRGRATVAANGRQIAVENSEIHIYGIDSPRYEIVGLPATDAFDRWVDERNVRFDRVYADAYRYASEDIVGATDLTEYGRWEDIPEYGYAWTPAVVTAGWAPFSNGRWYWQDPWGWSWISNERWGWATSHYGRWVPYRSRWYWVPVRPRTRVRYAPAYVEFVRVGDNIGWFPLHPRDRYTPWWQRRDRRFDNNVAYVNRNYITVVNQNNFISARPVNRYLVRDATILRQVRSARLTEALPIPNRSSLRIVSDTGVRHGFKPSTAVLNRTAVVRTAPPASPRAFQDKLAEIQKNQGRAVEPTRIVSTAADERGNRQRFRAAAETGPGEFAPRNPGAGPALQPVTEAHGKKLATRNSGSDAAKTVESKNIQVAPMAPTQPNKETSNRTQQPRQTPQEIERQKQAQEQQHQQQKQSDAERRRAQQQTDERKVQAQKQATQERQVEQRSREQQRLEELERRQAQQEGNRKAQQAQQNQQEQQRREQQVKQQQERQAQQRQQEIEHRQQEQRRDQPLQQQQEQARREQQLRQQQEAQQRQAREQQLRQQQAQQQVPRREEQERRAAPLPRQPQPQPQTQPIPQPSQLQR
jgi:hypothetical protein